MNALNYHLLYEFERLLSQTLVALFNSAELKARGISDAAELQADRPRVDVVVTAGASMQDHYVLDADGNRRENGWHGTFTLTAISAAEVKIHSAYLAAIRNLAAVLDQLNLADADVASVPLAYHEISKVRATGSSHNWKPEEGYYETLLHYEFIFGIRADAWPGGIFPVPLTLPFKVINGQLIPIPNRSVLKIWDEGANKFKFCRVINGQYRVMDA